MKKHLLSLIVFALIGSAVFAQDDRPVRIAFAIQPSSSWFKPEGKIIEADGARLGFAYGILTDFMIAGNSNYAFGTGVMINSVGGTLKSSRYHDEFTPIDANTTALLDEFAIATEKYRLQYLEIPLTLKLKTNEIGYLTYYGQFGLNLSFNIKSRLDVEYDFPSSQPLSQEDLNVGSDINLIRTALQVGAGAEYNISGETRIVAGLVWNNGLTDTFNLDEFKADPDGTPDIADNNIIARDKGRKAIQNHFGLLIGVFF